MGESDSLFNGVDLYLLLSGEEVSDAKWEEIRKLLNTSQAARNHYFQMMNLEVLLRDLKGAEEEFQHAPCVDENFWKEMLHEEKTAPVIQIPKETPSRELIQKVVYPPREKTKLSRFQKVFFGCNVAAALILVLFAMFIPPRKPAVTVAALDDSIDAVWDDKFQVPDAFGDMAQSRYRLEKGFASIRFNDGARVTVQGPAELSLNSAGDMELFSGKMYAIVPPQAQGFAVKAASNKIVDLGTEFGLEIGNTHDVQLHVTKGRTLLFAGLLAGDASQINVDAGNAKKVYSDGFVKDIPLADDRFVRKIDSKSGSLWRTETEQILFAEYFDYVGHTVKTPLNASTKWLKIDPANKANTSIFNYDGTLVEQDQKRPCPSMVQRFKPQAGKIYTVSLDVTNPTSGWVGLGFCRNDLGNYPRFRKTFDQTGIAWMRYGNTTPAIVAYTGVDASSIVNINKRHPEAGLKGPVQVRGAVHKTGPTTLMVKVDTTGTGEVFKVEYYQDGQKIAGPVAVPSTYFYYVGFSYKKTDAGTEYTDGILLDNFVMTVRE